MRPLKRDKQPMKYALYLGSLDIVETDFNGNPQSYIDGEGNTIYMVTGEKKEIYSEPVELKSSIGMSGSEASAQVYGFSITDFSATLILSKGAYPITVGTLIWTKSEVKYDTDTSMYFTADMKTLIEVKTPNKVSADYIVVKIDESPNVNRIILDAINK